VTSGLRWSEDEAGVSVVDLSGSVVKSIEGHPLTIGGDWKSSVHVTVDVAHGGGR